MYEFTLEKTEAGTFTVFLILKLTIVEKLIRACTQLQILKDNSLRAIFFF